MRDAYNSLWSKCVASRDGCVSKVPVRTLSDEGDAKDAWEAYLSHRSLASSHPVPSCLA